MSILDKIRQLFGGGRHEGATDQQTANREEADRALEAMNRRRD